MIINISVIICTTGNRREELRLCLESIMKQSYRISELLIVTGGLTEAAFNNVNEFVSELTMDEIHTRVVQTERGLTKQRNYGLSMACGDILCFLDDDVILHEDYMRILNGIFLEDSKGNIGGVDAVVYTESHNHGTFSGLVNVVKQALWYIGFGDTSTRVPPTIGPTLLKHWKRNMPTVRLSGCNMSFSRDALLGCEFDEFLEGYALGEDIDISLQVARRFQLLHLSNTWVRHLRSPIDRFSTEEKFRARIRNWSYLSEKHGLHVSRIYYLRMLISMSFEALLLSGKNRLSPYPVLQFLWTDMRFKEVTLNAFNHQHED